MSNESYSDRRDLNGRLQRSVSGALRNTAAKYPRSIPPDFISDAEKKILAAVWQILKAEDRRIAKSPHRNSALAITEGP